MKRPPLLSVAVSPHTHDGSSVSEIYLSQFIALLPAAIAGCLLWGTEGLRTLLLATGSAVILEWICARLRNQQICLADGSVLAQGLMLGMLLHAGTPWWLVLVAALLMVPFGKHFFGGLGGYPFSPPLLSYAILLISWPGRLNAASQLANCQLNFAALEPLVAWRSFGVEATQAFSLGDLFMGQQLGGVGSSMILWLLIGGLYLLLRGFIAWRIPLAFLGSVFVTAWIFHLAAPAAYPGPLFHLLSGMVVFAAFFLATDFTTSPVNGWAQVVFGIGCGLLTVLIRSFGIWPDGTVFAVLLMNLAHPLIDKIHPQVIEVEVPAR
ncbi:MAG: RnfABCDGE type electron transport complex subunit D [Candidatus Eisenbacteria sp.]|nr:RnfABCDGE type electron transport complex subunit D [Candidatus Eisenbacteria bacterium]